MANDIPGLHRELPRITPASTSVPLPGGGDTHIHPWGRGPQDFTITTRIPIRDRIGTVVIHNPSSGDDFKIE